MSEPRHNIIAAAAKLATVASLQAPPETIVTDGKNAKFHSASRTRACVKDPSTAACQLLGKGYKGGGTTDARKNLSSSNAQSVPKKSRSKRSTSELSERAAAEMLAAIQEALVIDLPLNLFLTINLEQGNVDDCVAAIGKFLTYYRQWLRSRGYDTAYVWCQEYGELKGQHVHILLHIPQHLTGEIGRRHRGWMKLCGAKSSRGLIYSRPVGKSRSAAFGDDVSRQDYLHNLKIVAAYIIKQVKNSAKFCLGMEKVERRSTVIGKRSGTSQNIGRKARDPRGRTDGPTTPWALVNSVPDSVIDREAG